MCVERAVYVGDMGAVDGPRVVYCRIIYYATWAYLDPLVFYGVEPMLSLPLL